jgi:actin-related protein 8
MSLRDRMRFYKLRITPNAKKLATDYNTLQKPEPLIELEDREAKRYRESLKEREVVVGHEVGWVSLPFFLSSFRGLLRTVEDG